MVCERWQSFDLFLEDMGERPAGMTLDRKDGTRGYAPDNCRWATPQEQSDNSRTAQWVEYQGERLTLSALARKLGLKKATVAYRLSKGWSEQALASIAEHGNRSRA